MLSIAAVDDDWKDGVGGGDGTFVCMGLKTPSVFHNNEF